MPHRITRLKLFRFRGATQPVTIEFDPQKSIVVIFGENGTGKSTLVDAIDAVSNASFGSVKRKGVDYPQKHISSLNEDVKTLEVELSTRAGHSWKATVSGPNVKVADVTTGGQRPSVRILRRRDLLQLIETTAADRYKAIQSFVDVAGVDKCESQLRSDLNALDSQFERADSARNTAEISLQTMWERERQPEETQLMAPAWAQHRVAEDLAQLRQQATRLSQQQTLTGQLATTAARWQEAYEAQQGCAERLAETQRLLDEQNNGEQHRRNELISLLSSAEKYLMPPTQPAACPLCANAVNADELRQRVRTQLPALMSSVSTAKKAFDTATAGCEQRGTELLKQLY
jgi:DNA repair exonuclease SbcCD ATPase subunit